MRWAVHSQRQDQARDVQKTAQQLSNDEDDPLKRVTVAATMFLLLLLVSEGCSDTSRGANANESALADTLTRIISEAYDFSRPGVVERMNALYAPTGQVISASGGAIIGTRDSLQAGIARFWDNVGRNMKNPVWKWGDVFVEPIGKDAAALTASWSIPHIAPDGQPHVISGAWTAVFRRTAAGWKIVQEHLSTG